MHDHHRLVQRDVVETVSSFGAVLEQPVGDMTQQHRDIDAAKDLLEMLVRVRPDVHTPILARGCDSVGPLQQGDRGGR